MSTLLKNPVTSATRASEVLLHNMAATTTIIRQHDAKTSIIKPTAIATTTVGVEDDKHWLMLLLILVPLWTMCGNLLVLLAVITFRQLRTLSNWVIASLAATDFLVAAIVQPLGIYQSVSGSPGHLNQVGKR